MRKWIGITAVLALLPLPALASMNVTINYPPAGYQRAGNGGVFVATVGSASDPIHGHAANTSFFTFCLETNEFINIGSLYVVGLSNQAVNGGAGGGSPDPLSTGAATLYLNYLGLSASDKMTQSPAYQQAIWYLEEEANHNAAVEALLDATFGDIDYSDANNLTGLRSDYTGSQVKVMNLTDASGNVKQDMLVAIPVPGAALLCFLGLGLVGWAKRRTA